MRDFQQKYSTEFYSLPSEYTCMFSEIVQSYERLHQRYQKSITKREEIWKLAQPKYKNTKYRQKKKGPDRITSKIEIIDMTDKTGRTRTEQLAFPKLRQLNSLKNHPSYKSFHDIRKSEVNRLIRKNLFSLYSRLQNVVPEKLTKKPTTLSSESKAKLLKRIKSLAEPKKIISIEEESSSKLPKPSEGPKMNRIRKLSKPRIYKQDQPFEWVLTDALKKFKPSKRLLKIAQPKIHETQIDDGALVHIPQNVLKYKATPRIKALSEPTKNKIKVEKQLPENPFQTNIRALKAIASKRTKELATPKDYSDMNNRDNPFSVSRRALQAKATPRLIQLSTPKNHK
ncbi:uncharacterized protein LOC142221958 [Haematobia irritans]|uniref:uncharacterized protein LOC142221958 n=1 Tax=Haematobia irritans TaxID=7368 RepID=UPI003F50A179